MAASDTWASRLASVSRRYELRSDLYEEEAERLVGGGGGGGDESKAELYLCPFCAEDFDVVGLCCHVEEEHPVEAKNGVCPVCSKRVGMDIVGHITTQHGSFFRVQRKRRLSKRVSNSTFALLRKELREGSLQSLLGGSSYLAASSNTEPDPLLSSFIFNPPDPSSQSPSLATAPVTSTTNEEFLERYVQKLPMSVKDQEEKSRRCEFVKGLWFSTLLEDRLLSVNSRSRQATCSYWLNLSMR